MTKPNVSVLPDGNVIAFYLTRLKRRFWAGPGPALGRLLPPGECLTRLSRAGALRNDRPARERCIQLLGRHS
jgi:hypothetical protein